MTAAEPDDFAFLPPRDPPTGQRYRLSLNKIGEELERYLPSARVEAADRLNTLLKASVSENQIAIARAELAYLEHSRGPAYQAQLLKQLGQRDVDAVITARQTPLERVREIGAALATRIKSQQPAVVQRAVRALEQSAPLPGEPQNARQVSAGKALDHGAAQQPPMTPAPAPRDKGHSR